MPVAGEDTYSLMSSPDDSMAETGLKDRTPHCAGRNKTSEDTDKGLQPDSIFSTDLSFVGRKKKRRPGNKHLFHDDSLNQETCEKTVEIRADGKTDDGDYQYQELLRRLYDSLKTEHPDLWEQQTTKIRIPAVYCAREGRKTVLLNFTDICKAVHRPPKHILDYLFCECATSGSIDIRNRVCLKGNFKPAGLQTIISKYVKEYVMCASCKSFHTLLIRETRLLFLHCEGCGSRRAVDAVKFGFRAITSRKNHR